MDFEAFFALHCDLPREGPGTDEATREAIRRLPPLPPCPRILDLGCGPGRQTLVLARELNVSVTAVDLHEPFLLQLQKAAAAEGLSDRIVIRQEDMGSLADPPLSIDLIWSEGAIYNLGFANGLRTLRSLLRNGGFLVASEATWLQENPPAEVAEFWQQEYPAMTAIDTNIKTATEAGFEVFDYFILPRSGWEEYYQPLRERIEILRPQAANDPALARVLAEHDREISICDRFGDSFGYVFYMMRKAKN